MSSSTEIANLALSHLAISKPIANLETEKSAAAAACRTFYDISRRRVLRDHIWPFARRVVELGLVEESPNEDWGYSYRYPSTALEIKKIFSGVRNDSPQSREKYVIAGDDTGKLIWADLNPACALIMVDVTDTQVFHDDFIMALSFLLAHYVAPRVMDGDPAQLGQRASQMYLQEISRAQASALNEESPDLVPESEFIRVRTGLDFDDDPKSFRSGL